MIASPLPLSPEEKLVCCLICASWGPITYHLLNQHLLFDWNREWEKKQNERVWFFNFIFFGWVLRRSKFQFISLDSRTVTHLKSSDQSVWSMLTRSLESERVHLSNTLVLFLFRPSMNELLCLQLLALGHLSVLDFATHWEILEQTSDKGTPMTVWSFIGVYTFYHLFSQFVSWLIVLYANMAGRPDDCDVTAHSYIF